MSSLNKVMIIGNLGADPETHKFDNGGMVTNISVATSEQWTDKKTGEKKEATEWHRIALFNRLAEIAAQYLRKGSKVYIEGSLQTRKWKDQAGQERYSTEVRASSLKMLDSLNNTGNSYQGQPTNTNQGYQGNQGTQQGQPMNQGQPANQGYQQPANQGYQQQPNNQGYQQSNQGNQGTQQGQPTNQGSPNNQPATQNVQQGGQAAQTAYNKNPAPAPAQGQNNASNQQPQGGQVNQQANQQAGQGNNPPIDEKNPDVPF